MKLLTFTSLLLAAFCALTANAATPLESPIDILDEPNYAQTRYAISHENCKLMWIVRVGQASSFFVREMRGQLLSAVQQGRPVQPSADAIEPGLAQASAQPKQSGARKTLDRDCQSRCGVRRSGQEFREHGLYPAPAQHRKTALHARWACAGLSIVFHADAAGVSAKRASDRA